MILNWRPHEINPDRDVAVGTVASAEQLPADLSTLYDGLPPAAAADLVKGVLKCVLSSLS